MRRGGLWLAERGLPISALISYIVSYLIEVRDERRFTRLIGSAGRLLVSSGLLVLAFAAYQLWGTGLLQGRTQAGLADEFDRYETQLSVGVESSQSGDDNAKDQAPPSVSSPVVVPASSIRRDSGQVVGRIRAQRIGLDQFIVEGVDPTQLKAGPGHYPGTPMPGMRGNASLAGHRTTWGAPFNRIDELRPGDEIQVDMPWGTATYVVDAQDDGEGGEIGHFIVDPSRVEVLDQDGSNRLTLTSCHPKFSARLRIIVTASLVSEPIEVEGGFDAVAPESLADEDLDAPTITQNYVSADDRAPGLTDERQELDSASSVGVAESSFGQGLSGDTTAMAPALAWSMAAIGAWLVARLVASRWRRRLTYAMAALPVAALWFVAFGFIDQVIPSY